MKNFITIGLLALTLPVFGQVNWREATPAEMAAGTAGTPVAVTPRRLAGAGLSSTSVVQQPLIATNNQILNTGSYFIPSGISISINQTNGGVLTINPLGNKSGIITSNWLAKGAVQNINCDIYCPNGGRTAFNFLTNEWMSVTCNIQCRLADFNQGTPLGTLMHEYTTNASDVFIINANERLNFWEIEVPLTGGGHADGHTAYLYNTIAPYIQWTTPYFYSGNVGKNGLTYTMNVINGSSISCGIWDVGNLTGNSSGNGNFFIQLWTRRGGSNAYLTWSIGEMISSDAAAYSSDSGCSYNTYDTDSDLQIDPTNGGIILPRAVYCRDPNETDVDFVDSSSTFGPSPFIIGTFYDAVDQTEITGINNQGVQTNRLSETTNAVPTYPFELLLPSYYSGLNFNGVTMVTLITNTAVPPATPVASLSMASLSYFNVSNGTTNTLAVAATGLTNNTSFNYLLTITGGTGLAIKDGFGNQFGTPVLGDTIPFKPGWRFTGTAITAQCYRQ